MRVLIVEDDASNVELVRQVLSELYTGAEVTVASSRDAAVERLDREFFDILILDLAIPAAADDGAPDPNFGLSVFGHSRRVAPGMPVFLLTGSSVESFVSTLLDSAEKIDIWGSGRVSTVSLLKKLDLDQCAEKLKPFVSGVAKLSDVELSRHDGMALTLAEDRLLRILATRFRGARCEVWELKGGLSGSRVVRIRISSAAGGVIQNAVGKLGPIGSIRDEYRRYADHVGQLPPATTPRLLISLQFGGRESGGVFYGLAEGSDSDVFVALGVADMHAAPSVPLIRDGLSPWIAAASQSSRAIRSVRQRCLDDAKHQELSAEFDLDWAGEFERRQVPVRWGCVHGDLHGANVLLQATGAPSIIDYGDIADGPLCLDPITLEFSVFFHPQGCLVDSVWPSVEQAENWSDLERYLDGCPCPEFVRACRAWTSGVAAGARDVAATSYAYFVRQLKYPATNKARALAFMSGSKRLFDST